MMREKVQAMIRSKQNATLAIAISLASDQNFAKQIKNQRIDETYYTKLIKSFKDETIYKNIWLQVLNDDLTSIYRSWSDRKGDNLKKVRKDLVDFQKTYKTTYSISVGIHDLTIKAIVPVVYEDETVGILEVISHFNSIAKLLEESDIDSVVILDKQYAKQLKYPFSNLFIGDYYVANLDARKVYMQELEEYGVSKYFNASSYIYNDNYLSTAYELKSLDERTLGYYIMFKNLDTISTVDLDFFVFKKSAVVLFLLMLVIVLVFLFMYSLMKKQKIYYKSIVNSSTNIVIISTAKNILDVNSVFFKYFYKYNTLEEFKEKHGCICELFCDEKGYLKKSINGDSWIECLLDHDDKNNKVKIEYDSHEYYFLISAYHISDDKDEYSIVLTDISNEEKYKKRLEVLSITDALTNISNRRFFDKSISREISNAQRYNQPLSLVMLDIDFFKKVNDEHGHKIGDDILIEYTRLISSMLRDGDIFCRVGGEEFMIILPYIDLLKAKKIAEKLRVKIESHKKILPITMSFGVTEYKDGDDEDSFSNRADKALYIAKDSGRNMVVTV